jgi:hypothetical protein
MTRVFNPLGQDHPLVRDGVRCLYCNEQFLRGDITTLVAVGEPDPAGPVYQNVHASCRLGVLEGILEAKG